MSCHQLEELKEAKGSLDGAENDPAVQLKSAIIGVRLLTLRTRDRCFLAPIIPRLLTLFPSVSLSQVHKSLLRIIAINHAQRQDRLLVMKGLMSKLETSMDVLSD